MKTLLIPFFLFSARFVSGDSDAPVFTSPADGSSLTWTVGATQTIAWKESFRNTFNIALWQFTEQRDSRYEGIESILVDVLYSMPNPTQIYENAV
jgi:hypothetical protein